MGTQHLNLERATRLRVSGGVFVGNDARSVAQALLKTGAAGLILGAIAVASGSLIPGMIVHAFVDLSSGDVAFALLSRVRGKAQILAEGPSTESRRCGARRFVWSDSPVDGEDTPPVSSLLQP